MKKLWLVVLSIYLFFAASAAAATAPSVMGEWALEGVIKVSASIRGYGSGSDREPVFVNASFNEDGRLWMDGEYFGTWAQNKNKIHMYVDTTDLEMMLNEYIFDETGIDLYVDFINSTGKASIKKDGVRLTSGKVYLKFRITGEGIAGKGAYKFSFKGERIVESAKMLADSIEEDQPGIVKSLGDIIISEYLKKK